MYCVFLCAIVYLVVCNGFLLQTHSGKATLKFGLFGNWFGQEKQLNENSKAIVDGISKTTSSVPVSNTEFVSSDAIVGRDKRRFVTITHKKDVDPFHLEIKPELLALGASEVAAAITEAATDAKRQQKEAMEKFMKSMMSDMFSNTKGMDNLMRGKLDELKGLLDKDFDD